MTKRISPKPDRAVLEKEYRALRPDAEPFLREVVPQLNRLLEQEGVALGFPLYHRVKDWASIANKLERQPLQGASVKDYQDLIGLRIVCCFAEMQKQSRTLSEGTFKSSANTTLKNVWVMIALAIRRITL